MVIQPPNTCTSNSNGPNIMNPSPTMLRQGGFFGKSRHAPVSSIELKRNSGVGEPPPMQRPPGVGPQSATGGNLQPLGTPIHAQRQSISAETQSQPTTAQISHETVQPQTMAKVAGSNQVVGDSTRSGSFETTDKESRDGTRPRKSVMRKVILRSFYIQNPIILCN